MNLNRREFVRKSSVLAAAVMSSSSLLSDRLWAADKSGMKFGFCTYLWGANWDLPTLIAKCEQADLHGVELRVQHKHGVEPELDAKQRGEVKKRFADSSVQLVGFGTNEDFHYADSVKVRAHLERAKEYVKLSADCGGSGVKVKPNDLPKGVDQKKTIAQIAKALDELGQFAEGYGQLIRLEVHGGCCRIPIIREIITQVESRNVKLCWNCNAADLLDDGFAPNLRSVMNYLGDTMHIHENFDQYPYEDLLSILVENNYKGWLLFENHKKIIDPTNDLVELHKIYKKMLAKL